MPGKGVYDNALTRTVGQISDSANTPAGFSTDISTILRIAALNTAMGGTPSHDRSADGFSVQITCNHPGGGTWKNEYGAPHLRAGADYRDKEAVVPINSGISGISSSGGLLR